MSLAFELPQELNIYSAPETRDALLAWVAAQTAQGKDTFDLSAANVAEVDGAGLQLLAALSNMEKNWRLVSTSTPFSEACQTLGFGHWIDKRHIQAHAPIASGQGASV